jgi:tetratricopeptide (TPR) repeat protein
MEIDPNNGLAYFHAHSAYMVKGLFDEALDALEKSKRLGFFGWGQNAAFIYLLKGDRENVERLFEEMIETKKTIEQTSSMLIAVGLELGESRPGLRIPGSGL